MYGDPSRMPDVAVKELAQNSFDAIKGMLEKGLMSRGQY